MLEKKRPIQIIQKLDLGNQNQETKKIQKEKKKEAKRQRRILRRRNRETRAQRRRIVSWKLLLAPNAR